MRDFEEEIRALKERTEQNRRQFLLAELQTCFIAADRARYELALGNTHEAQREFAIACKGAQAIERFLGEAQEQLTEIEARLAELRAVLKSLKRELETFPG